MYLNFDLQTWKEGIVKADRVLLARAITLVESTAAIDRANASLLLKSLPKPNKQSFRIGITGAPGVGKSTLIDRLGLEMLKDGYSLAVLTIDPSSTISMGSILGDKTRMQNLVTNERVFIRPSAASNTLGGVAYSSADSITLCEAAGYDIILIETVGVGQSEISVANLVDLCLYIQIPNSGDELQGMKKGIMEWADLFVLNKVENPKDSAVLKSLQELKSVISFHETKAHGIKPEVFLVSSLLGLGMESLWKGMRQFRDHITNSNYIYTNRRKQLIYRFKEKWPKLFMDQLQEISALSEKVKDLEIKIVSEELIPEEAAEVLINYIFAWFLKDGKH